MEFHSDHEFIEPYRHERNHLINIMQQEFIIVMEEQSKNKIKFGTTRANMSTAMNKGIEIRCKAVTHQAFIVTGLIFELSIALEE